MAQCRLVLCGAHAVLGDGGVLAPVGTLTMAYAAQAHGRPFYAVAAHYAFSSTHHVDAAAQTRARARPAPMPPRSTSSAAAGGVSASGSATAIMLEEPRRDATPPHLITLLITDVGVLTPSAVAEEMLRRGPV
jgi:translation initiation factor eIF-2B subunit alpha